MLKLFIQLSWALALVAAMPKKKVFEARYHKMFNYLKSSYDIFYGSCADHISTAPVEVDFAFDKVLLTSQTVSEGGVNCSGETHCICNPVPQYICDNNFSRNLLEVYACNMSLYVDKTDVPVYHRPGDATGFFLKSDLKFYRLKNVLGLGQGSAIYSSLAHQYDVPAIQFTVKTSLPYTNAEQLMDGYSKIYTEIAFFDYKLYKRQYRFESAAIMFKNTRVSFGRLDYAVTSAYVDYNMPHIAKMPVEMYEGIIARIKKTICYDVANCETEKDLIINYDRSQQLAFSFPTTEQGGDFVVYRRISDLFFIDCRSSIKFNIAESSTLGDEIVFGLLFLNTLELNVTYDTRYKVFEVILAYKEFKTFAACYKSLLFISLMLSVLIFLSMLRMCKPSQKAPSSSNLESNFMFN